VRAVAAAWPALVMVTLALPAQNVPQPTFRTDASYVRVDRSAISHGAIGHQP
jgi:hypothetical protein